MKIKLMGIINNNNVKGRNNENKINKSEPGLLSNSLKYRTVRMYKF